jgi:hypothetical protein
MPLSQRGSPSASVHQHASTLPSNDARALGSHQFRSGVSASPIWQTFWVRPVLPARPKEVYASFALQFPTLPATSSTRAATCIFWHPPPLVARAEAGHSLEADTSTFHRENRATFLLAPRCSQRKIQRRRPKKAPHRSAPADVQSTVQMGALSSRPAMPTVTISIGTATTTGNATPVRSSRATLPPARQRPIVNKSPFVFTVTNVWHRAQSSP